MALVINHIVTEIAVVPSAPGSTGTAGPTGAARAASADPAGSRDRPGLDEAEVDAIVRRATERVLETLRREWDS